MSTNYRGLRDSLKSYIPNWLSNRANGKNVGYRILYVCALIVDVALKYCIEGVYCWFPGYSLGAMGNQVDASTALPMVGRSRGIVRGEADTDAQYAAKLVPWLDEAEQLGSSELLAKRIQQYLGNTPMVRIVDRAGNWVTRDSSGNVTKTTASWNWDGTSNPERAGYWSDLWIIVYPTGWPITGTALSSLVGLWGNNDPGTELGNGHGVSPTAVNAILGIVEQVKGSHTWVVAIVWSYDATLFVPGTPASGDPDGTWGDWGKMSGGHWVPARTGASDGRVRYWVPNGG